MEGEVHIEEGVGYSGYTNSVSQGAGRFIGLEVMETVEEGGDGGCRDI